jgi:ribosomal protein S18 acetylase RimI-like enzyme
MELRTDLRPGDVAAIVALHAAVYGAEYQLDLTFEADVAFYVGETVRAGFPGAREGIWLVGGNGDGLHGSLALSDDGDGHGRVRWFVLDQRVRGTGLGRRLLSELLDHARAHGFAHLELETFSELRAAAHLYRGAGFERVAAHREQRWGRELEVERYALELSSPTDRR